MISVILTAYNAEKYIAQAIESIINQTYKDWELIIADDASTDNTCGIIKDCCSVAPAHVSFLRFPKNEGHTKALNRCLRMTKGDHIAWMDADDISEPTRFENQLKCFTNNTGIVTTHGISIDENGKRKKDPYTDNFQRRTQLEINMHLDSDAWVMMPSMMFKREVVDKIGGFDEECYFSQDTNFFVRAIQYFGWEKCEMELYRLRRHKESVRKINPRRKEKNWHTHAIERAKICPIVNL